MVKKPLALDHYAYLNELLSLKDDNRIESKKEIVAKEELIKKLIEHQKAFEATINGELAAEARANAIKIQRVLEILQDSKKREQYDETLTATPNIEVKVGEKNKNTTFMPLVPIEQIIDEFSNFKKEMLALKGKDGELLYTEDDFKFEKMDGPPTVYVFTFPDEASANAFLGRLFDKNMAMLPNGSQSLDSLKAPQSTQQSLKDKLSALKPPEVEQTPSPTPLKKTP